MKCCFLKQIIATDRSSHPQMFFKIGVLRNFTIFTEKRLCCSFFLSKKKHQHRYSLVNIAKFPRTDFSYRTPIVAASELESNIRLATQILTKTKRRYFYILIIAKQTKQIFLKRYDFFIHFNINENLKKINEKNRCFKPV